MVVAFNLVIRNADHAGVAVFAGGAGAGFITVRAGVEGGFIVVFH